MARVVKDAEMRREELLDTALRLFLQNGFDHTSVEQITSAVGVAKGTFYHYFESKQDLLRELVERFGRDLFERLQEDMAAVEGTALERMVALLSISSTIKMGRREELLRLAAPLYRPDNFVLRHYLTEEWIATTRPLITQIVEQGVAEGTFRIERPAATVELWLSLWYDYGSRLAEQFFAVLESGDGWDDVVDAIQALSSAQERILGLPEGSLTRDVGTLLDEATAAFRPADDARLQAG